MQLQARSVPFTSLLLDPNNYRFFDVEGWKEVQVNRVHEQRVQSNTLQLLLQTANFDLDALKDSIRTNGFVPLEQIVVRSYLHDTIRDKYMVVEGNRRIAAIMSLLDDADNAVCTLPAGFRESVQQLPVLFLDTALPDNAQAVEVLMAIRHVSGVKEWGAYQQAKLIVELKQEENATFTSVAEKLGMSARDVARRFRASMALRQMEEDDEFGDRALPKMYAIFHEVVAIPEVRAWLGWNDVEHKFTDREHMTDLYSGMCEGDGQTTKISSYAHIRKEVKAIIRHPRALETFRDPERTLSEAYQVALAADGVTTEAHGLEEGIASIIRVLENLAATTVRNLSGEQKEQLETLRTKIQEILTMHSQMSIVPE